MVLIQSALFLLFVTSTFAQNDVVIECKVDEVTVKWRPALNWAQRVDSSKVLLGSCPPSILKKDLLLFSVRLHECGFQRQVSEDKVTYTNMLTYEQGLGFAPIEEPVQCAFDTSGNSIDLQKSKDDHIFSIQLMNNDFSGPASSSMFTLGSRIPIKAEVEQQGSETLQIYLQRCVLATAPELARASKVHTLISNAGCLVESRRIEGNSTFLPREKPSEIHFFFQAFKFALGENIFLHCDMAAWDLQSFSIDNKACHYLKTQERWELLDNPSHSYICKCCDSTCIQRANSVSVLSTQKVLGPFSIVEEAQHKALDTFWTAEGLEVPVWVVAITVHLVLLIVAGAIATGYYLCFWRGGRLGYRPSRDLLTKY